MAGEPAGPQRVTIHAVAHGGEGIGRALEQTDDARVWFIEGALPGDTVLAEATQVKTRMIRGRTLALLDPSPLRQDPPCALADRCGGCGWQHVRADAQADLKAQIVTDLLRKFKVPIARVFASPAAEGYRRRARVHFEQGAGGLQLGFFGRGGHGVVDAVHCMVLEAPLRHALSRIRTVADVLPVRGELHGISDGTRAILGVAAQAEIGGQRLAMPPLLGDTRALRERLQALLDDTLVGIVIAGPRDSVGVGESALDIDASGPEDMSIRAGPFGFAQAQADQNAALVAHVLRFAAGDRRRRGLELFAGAGNFTRGLAGVTRELLAVETDAHGVEGLRQLAARIAVRGGARLIVRREPAATALSRAAEAGERFELVVLDPPRGGFGTGPARDLARVARGRTIYIACDPATLARDLAVLTQAGHTIVDVSVFDLMPMTPEVEVVVVLDAPESA